VFCTFLFISVCLDRIASYIRRKKIYVKHLCENSLQLEARNIAWNYTYWNIYANVCLWLFICLCLFDFKLQTHKERSQITVLLICYWFDIEIYVRVLVRSNSARRQERNFNYTPERLHIFPFQTNNLFVTYGITTKKLNTIYYNIFYQ